MALLTCSPVSDLPVLDPVDERVLGALLEKQTTVPGSYPMTANALRAACNQTSSRDPVVDYDEEQVVQAARSLKQRGLLRIVWSDTGRRTLKYHQVLDEVLGLEADERALLTLMLLRGPQSPGELKTRAERLYPFADREQVEDCLRRMAARPQPLVRELERRTGQHDPRWAHLLAALPQQDVAAPTVDLDTVLEAGADERDRRVKASYDAVAAAYADELADELDELAFERWLLDQVVDQVGAGPVVEAGMGPGHVTAYLAEGGADAFGVDFSPGMVAEAQRRFPDGSYEVGDLRRLSRPPTASGWAAVLAWYSLVHFADSELPEVLAALARPIAPRGWLVLGLHVGAEVRQVREMFGVEVELDLVLHDSGNVLGAMEAAGLVDLEWYLRGPILGRGETTQRFYVIGRKPSD